MDTRKIEELLEKYWLCETSVTEEEELRIFFNGDSVPGHLTKYKALFGIQQEESQLSLDDNFDKKILGMIDTDEKKQPRRFRLRPAMQVAASIIVLLAMWFAIKLSPSPGDPWKEDTYNNPEQALAEVQKVLSMVSGQMEKSQTLVVEKMEKAEPLTTIFKK